MNWKNAVVESGALALDAIRILDTSGFFICFVTDSNLRLLGSVTDGDVRRGLLRGNTVNDPVEAFMNRHPIVAKATQSRAEFIQQMKLHGIRQIPIVDDENRIQGIEVSADLLGSQAQKGAVLIMAGGAGRRLLPLTENCPKPMLKVGSKPVLEVILSRFIENGFKDFYISINYHGRMIEDYFGDGRRWGASIQYLREESFLGTAGALSLLPEELNQPLIVMNGDLLTKVDFNQLIEFHENQNSPATMCVRKYEHRVPYGVINVENHEIRGIDEKPVHRHFVNSGIYVLNPDVLPLVPKNTRYDMTTLFQELMSLGRPPSAFPLHEYWLDIGHIDDFRRAEDEFGEVFK